MWLCFIQHLCEFQPHVLTPGTIHGTHTENDTIFPDSNYVFVLICRNNKHGLCDFKNNTVTTISLNKYIFLNEFWQKAHISTYKVLMVEQKILREILTSFFVVRSLSWKSAQNNFNLTHSVGIAVYVFVFVLMT